MIGFSDLDSNDSIRAGSIRFSSASKSILSCPPPMDVVWVILVGGAESKSSETSLSSVSSNPHCSSSSSQVLLSFASGSTSPGDSFAGTPESISSEREGTSTSSGSSISALVIEISGIGDSDFVSNDSNRIGSLRFSELAHSSSTSKSILSCPPFMGAVWLILAGGVESKAISGCEASRSTSSSGGGKGESAS